jgi:putative MATE family efflux protein
MASSPADDAESPLVTRPLARATLALAGPTIASLTLQATFAIVDMFWVGRLGAAPLAAVNVAAFVVWTVDSLAVLCSIGTNALVARHVGAGDAGAARVTAGHALHLALIVSAATTAAGLASNHAIFAFMQTDEEVSRLGREFLFVTFLGVAPVFFWAAVEAVFRAHGDTRTPMKLTAAALAANVVLDPLLIYGLGPFPRMGVAGAAAATVLCRAGAVAWGLALVRRRGLARLAATWEPAPGMAARIAHVGAPIAISQVSFCLVYMALARVIARFGTPAVAAVGIGHKCESVAYFVSAGFSYAAATMVGQNLGAGRPDRASRAAWAACRYALGPAALVGAAMLAFPEALARFFIDDPVVVEVAVRYLRIVAVSELFLVFEIVLEGAFGGAGDSVPPLVVGGPLSVARVPAAYLLAVTLGWGVDGVWWAISVTTVLKGALIAVWYARRHGRPQPQGTR